ncbi:MAG: hypothetical protein KGI33_03550 [Thaumarchaeota archaeon]|nr:hypothetical protein [Nitrososphaerota archaeon]
MVEFLTRYPKTVSLLDGMKEMVRVDKDGVEQLTIVVRKSVDEMLKLFAKEGFTHVKFEHKQTTQIGHGLSLKLRKPWEMHVRLLEMKKGLVAIQAEVEVSRDYLQHLFCQRTPVLYEVESLLKKHQIEYNIWNQRIRKYVKTVVDNYRVQLKTPSFPVLAWKPMVFFIGATGVLYLFKYLLTV